MNSPNLRICFLFNPSANSGVAKKRLNWLRSAVESKLPDIDYEIVLTSKKPNDYKTTQFASFDIIVACGGDGTLHEAVNIAVEHNCALGLIPLGSGNDFAKAIGLPNNLGECLSIIARGKTKNIDLLKCTGDADAWCVNTLGIGLDGLANLYMKKYKPFFGSFGYVLGAVHSSLTSKNVGFTITVDNEKQDGVYRMITACNGPVEGGFFHVAPEAKVDDGKMDLVRISSISFLRLIAFLPKFKKPTPFKMEELTRTKCTKVELEAETGCAVHADGERLGEEIRHLTIVTHPGKVKMLVP